MKSIRGNMIQTGILIANCILRCCSAALEVVCLCLFFCPIVPALFRHIRFTIHLDSIMLDKMIAKAILWLALIHITVVSPGSWPLKKSVWKPLLSAAIGLKANLPSTKKVAWICIWIMNQTSFLQSSIVWLNSTSCCARVSANRYSLPVLQTCQLSVLKNPLLFESISLFSQMKSKYVFSINICVYWYILVHICLSVGKTLLENHNKCNKNPQNFNLSRLALFTLHIWWVLLWCRLTGLCARACP